MGLDSLFRKILIISYELGETYLMVFIDILFVYVWLE